MAPENSHDIIMSAPSQPTGREPLFLRSLFWERTVLSPLEIVERIQLTSKARSPRPMGPAAWDQAIENDQAASHLFRRFPPPWSAKPIPGGYVVKTPRARRSPMSMRRYRSLEIGKQLSVRPLSLGVVEPSAVNEAGQLAASVRDTRQTRRSPG
jgi:hypothetical protein